MIDKHKYVRIVKIRSEIRDINDVEELRCWRMINQMMPVISANNTEINERICKRNKIRPEEKFGFDFFD